MSLTAGPEFEALLEFLRQDRGFDFGGYKRTTLVRRVAKRAQQLNLDDFGEYLDYLQVHADEYSILFNTILINVTDFFRDAQAWEYLAASVIPQILAGSDGGPIRVWSAGCASGQEPYSVAMLLCERLGTTDFVERVKVYATDLDEDALSHARLGYTPKEMQSVPEDLRSKYFELQGGRFVFHALLRRSLIFGRHDLVQDAPISRLDLLICRNTLMYFTAESQGRILTRFHYALKDSGFLFLGRSEMILTHGALFRPVDVRNHVFTKVPRVQLREHLLQLSGNGPPDIEQPSDRTVRLRDLADETSPTAQLLVDSGGILVYANQEARGLLKIAPADVGRPLKDLQASYTPVELRSHIDRAAEERAAVLLENVEVEDGRYYGVHVVPLIETDGALLGTEVRFADTSAYRRLQGELERSKHDVETAYEELQSSNEELETTNEELQSTVEELETTNEELQSSNEELETMNEELESTNSELQTINSDLRQRTDEVDRLNTFMEAIFTSIQVGVMVVDGRGRITLWNSRSEDLWGLRSGEAIDQELASLDIGLPVATLIPMVKRAQNNHGQAEEVVVSATNRRGRAIRCRVLVTSLAEPDEDVSGAVVVVEQLEPE